MSFFRSVLTSSLLCWFSIVCQAQELTDFGMQLKNGIGEPTLSMKWELKRKELVSLKIPLNKINEDLWREQGRLTLDWSFCRSQEMFAGNGRLNQCIRRAFLAIRGEGDNLRSAKLYLQVLKDGRIGVSYKPSNASDQNLEFLAATKFAGSQWKSYFAKLNRESLPVSFKTSATEISTLKAAEFESGSVHFIFFGDSGTGTQEQYDVANGIKSFCKTQQCDFVVMLGDNFYGTGVSGPRDGQFQTKFEKPYEDIELVFKPSLGNHDHMGNIRGQIEYSKYSAKWDMPSRYYHYKAGHAELFAIDSDDFDGVQIQWLEARLKASQARWKIVYGHHPVYSYGAHGDTSELVGKLLPILKRQQVDMFLAGHDHDKQVIERDGILFVVSGAAAKLRPTNRGSHSLFARSSLGFSHFSIKENVAHLQILNQKGDIEFEKTISKSATDQEVNRTKAAFH